MKKLASWRRNWSRNWLLTEELAGHYQSSWKKTSLSVPVKVDLTKGLILLSSKVSENLSICYNFKGIKTIFTTLQSERKHHIWKPPKIKNLKAFIWQFFTTKKPGNLTHVNLCKIKEYFSLVFEFFRKGRWVENIKFHISEIAKHAMEISTCFLNFLRNRVQG